MIENKNKIAFFGLKPSQNNNIELSLFKIVNVLMKKKSTKL